MKKIKYYFLLLSILSTGMLASCNDLSVGSDFLSKPPTIDFNQETVFSSVENVQKLLTNIYATIPYGLGVYKPGNGNRRAFVSSYQGYGTTVALTDLASTMKGDGTWNPWYTGKISPSYKPNKRYDFTGGLQWKAIYEGYTLINNIHKVPNLGQKRENRMKAQAKMIIAIHYVNMFENIGGVVWIGGAKEPSDNLDVQRLTVMASVDSISALLDYAIKYLPKDPTGYDISPSYGRMTATGAVALKLRLLLFAASPLFNSDEPYMRGEAARKKLVWTGGYKPSLWKRAAEVGEKAVKMIESSSYYHMIMPQTQDSAGYRKAYRRGYLSRSPETLIPSIKEFQINNVKETFWTYITGVAWTKFACPTQNYAWLFTDKNGVRIEKSSIYDPKHPYRNRDPRFYETLTSNISDWSNGTRKAEMYIGGRERPKKEFGNATAGYLIRKFVLDRTQIIGHTIQWPYLRIPEVYLSYAEALNEVHNGPTAEAFKYVNKVRNRVGLKDIQKIRSFTEEEFNRFLLKARAREFGFENLRLYDMVRRKRKDLFQQELIGLNLYKIDSNPSTPAPPADADICNGDYCFDYFSITDKWPRYWQNNFNPKIYLNPIPQNEINKNYGLTQNPGW